MIHILKSLKKYTALSYSIFFPLFNLGIENCFNFCYPISSCLYVIFKYNKMRKS